MESTEANSAAEVDTENPLVKSKDHGSLTKASKSVLTVCKETEKSFDRMKAVLESALPQASDLAAVLWQILVEVGLNVFITISAHMHCMFPHRAAVTLL